MKKILIVVALGACATQDNSTPLARLSTTYGDTQLEIATRSQLNIVLHVNSGPDTCPTLGEDVTASFDGAAMQVSRGGYDLDSSGCYPIAFFISPLPMDMINGFERTTSSSQLVVQDKSAIWGVNTGKLFANDFENDTAHGRITWTDVAVISTAQLSPQTPFTIAGNVISYTPGTQLDWVSAWAHPIPSKCDGPGLCLVNLEGDRAFGPIIP